VTDYDPAAEAGLTRRRSSAISTITAMWLAG
jgi:hypothetical protein